MLNTQDTATLSTEERLSHPVSEWANIGILACEPEAPLTEVAWLMANNSVHAVIVVRDDVAEPPVISDADLVAAMASDHFDRLAAQDIAVTEPVSITENETLARAAQLLYERGVAHLIVRNERGAPIGVISSLDLARAVASSEVARREGRTPG